MGVAGGDFDNDGDIDMYVTNLGRNTLLQNEGDGTFADVTDTAGVGDTGFGAGATFADFNRDGHLDLYVTNYVHWSSTTDAGCLSPTGGPDYCSPNHFRAPATDVLYMNNGNGSFRNVTTGAGLTSGFGNGLGVLAADFNNDFLIDFFVANDGMPDQLWQNNGNGTFTDVALVAGCAVDLGGSSKAGMGIDARDLDEDGDLDLLVGNLTGETDSLFHNEGGYFIDRTIAAGLAAESQRYTRFGLGFVDFDHDGRLDLFEATGRVSKTDKMWTDDPFAEPNLLWRGLEGNRYEPVQPPGGTGDLLAAAGRAAAFGDVDGDLDIDVLVVNRDGPAHLLINRAPASRRAVLFRVLNEHGADAIGARVTMKLGSRTLRRDVRTGYSYLACNDPRIHVGTGDARSVTNVRVRWNDGTSEHFGDFDTGALHHLRRGGGRPAAAD
jgi:predicted nucleotidyltransferase